jgi:hypothetical protein
MYGAVRDATAEETAAIRAVQYAQLDHCGKQAFGELDFVDALMARSPSEKSMQHAGSV